MAERITGVGARRERLKVSDFLGFELDLPPLDEQRAMVSAVTTMDAAITTGTAERAAAFGLLDAARDALIVPTGTWNELPEQWVMRSLGDVADVRTGIAKGRITQKETRPHPFLRAANVQNGFLDLTEIKDIDVTADEAVRFALRSGDVLMVEGSGSPDRLGRGWVWDGEVERCIHQNHVFRARPDMSLVLSRFLAHLLAATPVRAYFRAAAKTTSGLSTINSTQTRALPIPCPPVEQQQRIADMLDAVRATAVAVHREQKQLLSLRTAFVESMLSGAWPQSRAVLQLVSA
jgi:type I restriction enzyme, S subunit